MFQDLSDFDRSVYHFTSTKNALMYILPSMMLKLASICDVNDPKENKSFGFGSIYSEFENDKRLNFVKSVFELYVKKYCRLSCFSGDYYINENKTNFIKLGFDHPTMWAHYAEKYKGICLVLDKDALKKEIKIDNNNFYFDCIGYRNLIDFPPIKKDAFSLDMSEYFENYIKNNNDAFFFQKYGHWSHEHEYRLVHIGTQEYFSIKKSLMGIYLGPEFDNKLNNLLKLLLKPDIWISQLIIKDGNLFPIDYRIKMN